MVITLDGTSGSGKSTLAKKLAEKLNFNFLNSGMIYRSFAYIFLTEGLSYENLSKIQIKKDYKCKVDFKSGVQYVLINNIDCTPFVSNPEVTASVSIFSQNLNLREYIEEVQRDIAKNSSIVIEGRDIGSVVFPDAEFKFYVDASVEIRAERRFHDLVKDNPELTLEEVKNQIIKRDSEDKTRKFSPLIIPKNAIFIDNGKNSLEENIDLMLKYIKGV